MVRMLEAKAAASARNVDSTWSIPEAVVIGVGGFSVAMTLLFCATLEIDRYRLYLKFSTYQLSTGSTLISLIGTGMILGLIVLLIVKGQRWGRGWRESIEWNGGRYLTQSVLAGAGSAVLLSLVMTAVYGTAGRFRDTPLALGLSLYFLTEVLVEPVLEEVYFRGILYLALARKIGRLNSVVVVTLIFAFMHPGHRLNILPIAALLGIARLKTNSVSSCVALHASYNLSLAIYQLVVTK
jgi:membrane protease YdiL (CAAX protease family)